jgi:hypothetical protein
MSLLLSIILVASMPKEPDLRRQSKTGRYEAINPLRVPVTLNIHCLGDYADFALTIAAGTKEELEIKTPDGDAAACYLQSWAK